MSLIPYGFWGGVNEVTFSTGLKGARFVGYFADDPTWFATAQPHGDVQNNVTSISSFSSNADLYSWVWYGYFLAPTSGQYTFYTTSDDASYLWLGTNALNPTTGNALVNNGGLHGAVEQSGTVTLEADTYYAMLIMFGENGGGDIMTVNFSGPGITKTTDGTGYYFGGQETYGGGWVNYGGAVVPRFDEEEGGGGPSGIVTDQLICNLDARINASVGTFEGTRLWIDQTGLSTCYLTTGTLEKYNANGYFAWTGNTSDYADLNLDGGFITSATPTLTIEMWTRPTEPTEAMFFGFNTYDVYSVGGRLGFNTAAGDLRGMSSGQVGNGIKTWGQWNHMVFVMQQTTSYTNNKIYVNGTLIYNVAQQLGTENTGNRSFNNGSMRINGWLQSFGYALTQDLSIFRVYKKELTQEEVWQNYNADRTHSLFSKPAIKNVVPDGCRFYTDMEGSTDWFGLSGSYVRDYSGYAFFATAFGGSAWNSDAGGNYQFRAANSRYFNINRDGNGTGIFYGSGTYVYVVRMLNFTQNPAIIYHPTDALGAGKGPALQVLSNASFEYNQGSANPPNTLANYGALSANTWYHVAMSYDYATYTVKIYINGQPVVTNGFQERVTSLTGYYIGRNTGQYYDFDLGLLMVYNRVLSDSEVLQLFDAQKTRFGL